MQQLFLSMKGTAYNPGKNYTATMVLAGAFLT